MVQTLDTLRETASQTAGPYVHIGLMPGWAGNPGMYDTELGQTPAGQSARGERIEITGAVHDGTGAVMRDALIESWQADAAGLYPGQDGADPGVSGFGRFAADPETGLFTLRTIKPGSVALPDGRVQSPHIALWIVARGINIGLMTRIYFDDADRDGDPVLSRIEQRHRVDTLIARPEGDGRWRFDIRLQGEGETVFLDV
jgi:protocatechuate 3,4-dioxygenase alpha subunit